jgi:hypothetical protein
VSPRVAGQAGTDRVRVVAVSYVVQDALKGVFD